MRQPCLIYADMRKEGGNHAEKINLSILGAAPRTFRVYAVLDCAFVGEFGVFLFGLEHWTFLHAGISRAWKLCYTVAGPGVVRPF